MATKEAVFSLRVDTGNSVQDIQNADQAVKNFNKDLKETQVTASSGTGMDAFQQNLDELNAKVSAGGLTMRDMTKAMKEYQSIAAQAGVESPVGAEALRSAAQMKDTIGDLKGATTALSSDFVKLDTAVQGIETGAAVFQGLQSAVALTGIENENLQKTMVKLQATQGIVNAVNTVAKNLNKDAILGIHLRTGAEKVRNLIMTGTIASTRAQAAGEVLLGAATAGSTVATEGSTMAMKLFRLALIATGIGALVVGIGMLISNFDKILSFIKPVIDAFKALGDWIGLTDFAGEERAANESKRFEEEKRQNKRLAELKKANFEKEQSNFDRLIAVAEAEGKSSVALQTAKIQASIKYQKEQGNELRNSIRNQKAFMEQTLQLLKDNPGMQALTRKLLEEELDKTQALLDAADESIANSENELKLLKINTQKEISDNNKKSHESEKEKIDEANKSKLEILKSHLEREIKAIEDSENLRISQMVEGQAKTIATLEDTYGDWREQVILKASQTEFKALDEKFAKGKMSEEDYRKEIQSIMANGVKNLTAEEVKLMTEKEAQLGEGIRRAKLTAQERELEDVSASFADQIALANSQGEEGKEKALQLVIDEEVAKAKIRKKYADLALEEAARVEAVRRERTKFLNSLIATDQEIALQELNNQQSDAKKELLKRLNSENVNEKITQEEFDAAMLGLEKKKIAAIKKINLDATTSAKAVEQKEREEELAAVTKGLETAQKALDQVKIVNDLLNEIGAARINKINKERDEDLESIDAQKQAELNAEGLTAQQKTDIEEKFAKQKFAVQLDAFNKEDKINRAKFNRDKAIKLAQVAMDTASAITKGIAQFGPPPSAAGIAAIASAGIIGVTQALAIANQKYQGGTAPTMPSVSGGGGGGGGGSMAGTSGSSFTASTSTTSTSTNGLLQDAQTASQPVQVFVLENDISSTQNKVAVQEQKSSF
jgi:hypothetical protein